MKPAPAPPKDLSQAAKTWWATLTRDYMIEGNDSAGLLLLETALRAFDRMTQAQALIVEHGLVTVDRHAQLRPNPACVIERDSRAAMLMALKSLNLDLEPLHQRPGRPGKG